ncbi:transposon Tf2-6 polyprotein [Trichonephila clavipes]|nr:transposon Tf2-6 polyprotein [Trichonephila clavipes]
MRYDNNNTGYESNKKKVCFNCGDPNHISRNSLYKNKGIKCFRCEVFGYKASECPDNNDTKLDVAHLIINKKETLTKKVLIGGLILDALIDSGSQVTLIRKSVYDKINHVQLFPLNTTLRGFSNSKVRLFGYFKDDIQSDELKGNVGICLADDDAMLFDVVFGLNVLMQACKERWFTWERRPKNCVTVSPAVKVSVELQHPSDWSKLEDDLKRLEKPDPIIQRVTEESDEYIVSDTEEFVFENYLKDVEEDKACILLKKTDPVVVVPESVPKEINRRAHDKRCPRIKENKDYFFIPKRRRKIKNSVAYCDHRVLVSHKRRKKEDVPLKTFHIDLLGPHSITEIEEGIMEQTKQDERRKRSKTKDVKEAKYDERRINKNIDVENKRKEISFSRPLVVLGFFVSLQCRLEDQPIPGWPCGVDRYFQATPIILLLMLTNALSV